MLPRDNHDAALAWCSRRRSAGTAVIGRLQKVAVLRAVDLFFFSLQLSSAVLAPIGLAKLAREHRKPSWENWGVGPALPRPSANLRSCVERKQPSSRWIKAGF